MTIFDMVKHDPKFKRFCARQTTRPVKRERFKVPMPRAKGLNSTLGTYTTGRRVKITWYSESGGARLAYSCYEQDEIAVLKKVSGEFTSQIIGSDNDHATSETVPQLTRDAFYRCDKPEQEPEQDEKLQKQVALLEEQNRLLRVLVAA